MLETTDKTALAELARAALESAGGDERAAAEAIKAQLRERADLQRQLLESFMDRAIWRLLQSLRTPAAAKGTYEPRQAAGDDVSDQTMMGLCRLATANMRDLLMLRLRFAGVRLGQASRDMLHQEIATHEREAREHVQLSMFYRAVIRKMGAAATVDRALSNADLQRLMREVERELRDD